MNRHDRRAAAAQGDKTVTHEFKCAVCLFEGFYWAFSQHFIVRMAAENDPAFKPGPNTVIKPPANFGEILAAVPDRVAPVEPSDKPTLRWIGGTLVDQKLILVVVGSHGQALEWRVSASWEPAYALKEGTVVGVIMGIASPIGQA